MVALYDATDGANWEVIRNWKTTAPIEEWYGVVYAWAGRVFILHLHDNRLSGTIPAELDNLTRLTELSLFSNRLSGAIPASLGNLTRLRYLSLYGNQLTGTIPASLGNLSPLGSLMLAHNRLSGTIPASLGNLSRLRLLNLNDNQLTGTIPATLGNLTELAYLGLDNNQLSGAIPASLGNLSRDRLERLSLYGNQLSGTIPASLGNLSRLESLNLNDNRLSGTIPAELDNLTRLLYLGLNNNQLTGTIPATLDNLSRLEYLNLNNNQLTGEIPAELGQLTQLTDLNLGGNQLSGTIPASLGNLIRLTELDLYGNRLSGTIPASLGNLIDLDYLSLDTDTGLCLAHGFPLTSMFARLAQAHTPPIAVCNGDTPDGPTPEVFTLDFAHFANGDGITSDLVFVNVGTHPIRPALYFYDKEGHLIAAESVVDIMGDLEVAGDGSLTVQTEIEPLGELTISTHGGGEVVTGSVTVDANGPIGGVLRFDLPDIGVAGVGASSPLSDAIFPVRRQEAGINTGVAIHNLESSPEIVRCELMQGGTVLDDVSIPLAANGQSSWFIDAAFTAADTSGFVGSVRCDAVGTGMFTAVALELDAVNRIFTTLPVVPVPERTDRE